MFAKIELFNRHHQFRDDYFHYCIYQIFCVCNIIYTGVCVVYAAEEDGKEVYNANFEEVKSCFAAYTK